MSSKLTLTIKDFQMRGATVTFKITSAVTGQKMVGAMSVPKLIITRKPDSFSPHFFILAKLRRANPANQDWNLPQLTVTNDRCDKDDKFVSSTMIDFFDAVVDDAVPSGDEEKITFLADRKSGEFTISGVEVWFD